MAGNRYFIWNIEGPVIFPTMWPAFGWKLNSDIPNILLIRLNTGLTIIQYGSVKEYSPYITSIENISKSL